jgi:hypothetical protein
VPDPLHQVGADPLDEHGLNIREADDADHQEQQDDKSQRDLEQKAENSVFYYSDLIFVLRQCLWI